MNEPDCLQSADWAQFQAAVGHSVLEANGLYYFKHGLPFGGSYLYCPHPDVHSAEQFLDDAVGLARRESSWFVRVEPNAGSAPFIIHHPSLIMSGTSSRSTIYDLRPTLPVQPPDTWHVLLGSDETMLAAMHEKTRYNIKLAEKRGMTVRFSNDVTDVEILTTLIGKTGERAGIRIHPERYYRTMIETLGARAESREQRVEKDSTTNSTLNSQLSTLVVELAIAEFPTSPEGLRGASAGKPAAAALIAHYGDRTIYLHGGSDYEQRNLMAPHALHWAVMRRTRDAGALVYDMGGIAPPVAEPPTSNLQPPKNLQPQTSNSETTTIHDSRFTIHQSHPWAGITRFKMGFGGQAVHYPPAVDVVVRPTLYSVYTMARRFRRSVI